MSGNHGIHPASVKTVAEVENSTRISHLLKRMSWTAPLMMILAALAVAAGFYWLQARPLANDSANARQQEAVERVVAKVESLLGQIEGVLLTMRDWSRDGMASVDKASAFDQLFIPVIRQHGVISSIHLATDTGQEILLLRTPDGWKNRLTDIPVKGKQQHWLSWGDKQTIPDDEWKEQDYDPRQRPWFVGALATPENEVHWTAPYIFQTTQDPGITASIRWSDPRTGQQFVAALDVLLSDLSRFTSHLSFGKNGQVVLLTDDGKVLGLPRNAGFDDDESFRKAVLQEPGKIGLKVLEAALKKVSASSDKIAVTGESAGKKEDWTVSFYRLDARNQKFRVATLAPIRDFSPWSSRLVLVLLGVLASVIVLGAAMSRRITRDINRPLEKVFLDLETSNRQIGIQIARTAAVAELAPLLQAADSFEELSHALLAGLAQRISLGQGSIYRADNTLQRLLLCGAYARPTAAMPAEIRFGEGLAGQCALERKTIRLDHPAKGYLRIESVLGGGDPAVILLLPIENQEVLLGVIEFALMHDLSNEESALIDSLMPMLALCMEILSRNERTRQLLQASQQQATELSAQQERIQALINEQNAIFNNAPMGILHVTDGLVHRANRELTALLKRKEDELVGCEVASLFISADEYRQFAGTIESRLAVGDGARQEWQLLGPDQQSIQVMIAVQRLQMEGVKEAAIWAIEDITERKRAEQAIQENEVLLRQILEDSPAAVSIATEDGRQVFANRRLPEMLGVPPGSLLTRTGPDLWANAEDHSTFLQTLKVQGRVDGYSARFLRFDGREITVVLYTRWIEKGGKRLLLTWIYDLGEHKTIAPGAAP